MASWPDPFDPNANNFMDSFCFLSLVSTVEVWTHSELILELAGNSRICPLVFHRLTSRLVEALCRGMLEGIQCCEGNSLRGGLGRLSDKYGASKNNVGSKLVT